MTTIVRGASVEWHTPRGRVLGPVDLEVERGECVAIVGPNGAGKTTLLRLVAGLLRPSAGRLELDGREVRELPRHELALELAYVPQVRPSRIPLTVAELVLLGRYPHWRRRGGAPSSQDFRAVAAALARVGLEAVSNRPLDELSGGERQGAFLAACLAQESKVLVLDEPTTHLDPRHQGDVARLILELAGEAERTVLCATHDLNFASLIADRIVGLREGRVAAAGRPAEVLSPEVLGRLFDARFEIVEGGARPLTILHLERQ